MVSSSNDTGERVSRRHLLQVGGLGLLGVTLPRLLESRARCEATGIRPKFSDRLLVTGIELPAGMFEFARRR